jgi:hypothetical protein
VQRRIAGPRLRADAAAPRPAGGDRAAARSGRKGVQGPGRADRDRARAGGHGPPRRGGGGRARGRDRGQDREGLDPEPRGRDRARHLRPRRRSHAAGPAALPDRGSADGRGARLRRGDAAHLRARGPGRARLRGRRAGESARCSPAP